MSVRDARPADAEAVRTVHYTSILELGPEAYSTQQVRAWARGCGSAEYATAIETEELEYVVAERDGVIVGFGSLRLENESDGDTDAEVTAVYVLPTVTREGVGTEIYTALERRARDHGIEVLDLKASLPAVPFYETHGYRKVAEQTHEFSSEEGTGITGRVIEMKKRL